MIDESTIMPIVLHMFVMNSRSYHSTCITAPPQMISRCIGWGPKPTWNGSHIYSIHIQWVLDHHMLLMVDESTIMPIVPHLLAQNSCSWQIFWITARIQMMSRCIGWGPKPTWNGSHILLIHIQCVLDHSYTDNGRWIHHHAIAPRLWALSLGCWQSSWITQRGYKWCQGEGLWQISWGVMVDEATSPSKCQHPTSVLLVDLWYVF